jgi:hypothetical protein
LVIKMTRRLPTCAWCGERLKGANVRHRYDALPGKPELGWHADNPCCWKDDPVHEKLADRAEDRDVPALLLEVEKRGLGRGS